MDDLIIKGAGNSRYLRSVANILTLYPTYEAFAEALASGTFPIDLNGINPSGVEQVGTKLDKANLLSDNTADLLGGVKTVNEALARIPGLDMDLCYVHWISESGTWTSPANIIGESIVIAVGGGGSGGGGGSASAATSLPGTGGGGGGGGSGYIKFFKVKIPPNTVCTAEIGSGGAAVRRGDNPPSSGINGNQGGTTLFTVQGGVTVRAVGGAGGYGGNHGAGSGGGQGGRGGDGSQGGGGGGGGGSGATYYSGGRGGTGGNGEWTNGTAGLTGTSGIGGDGGAGGVGPGSGGEGARGGQGYRSGAAGGYGATLSNTGMVSAEFFAEQTHQMLTIPISLGRVGSGGQGGFGGYQGMNSGQGGESTAGSPGAVIIIYQTKE